MKDCKHFVIRKRRCGRRRNSIGSGVRKVGFWIPALLLFSRWPWRLSLLFLSPPVESSQQYTRRRAVFWPVPGGPRVLMRGQALWLRDWLPLTNFINDSLEMKLHAFCLIVGYSELARGTRTWILRLIHSSHVGNYMGSQTVIKTLVGEHEIFTYSTKDVRSPKTC